MLESIQLYFIWKTVKSWGTSIRHRRNIWKTNFRQNCCVQCLLSPIVAAKSAKKNPANPVAPVNKSSMPIITGIAAKNFSLYASRSGSMNFLYFFFILKPPFPLPSISSDSSELTVKNNTIITIFVVHIQKNK